MSGFTRRSFFKIVASSGAAVAAGGCGNDVNELVGNIPEKLIPYVVPPDNIVPGVAAYFSTVCRECPAGCGLVAKNRDGRVIKLEGNPDHPVNAGALCIRGQAALQGLYHPDRYRGALMAGKSVAWDAAEKGLADKLQGLLKAKQGSKIALVTGLETGSLGRLMDEWTKALGARPRITYEPLGYEALRAANRATVEEFYKAALAAGGRDNGPPGLRPHYHQDYYGAFVLDPDGHNIEAVCRRKQT